MLKYKYISQIKYAEKVLSNSTRKLLWFEITRMLIAVFRKINLLCHLLKFLAFIKIFGTLSFPMRNEICARLRSLGSGGVRV